MRAFILVAASAAQLAAGATFVSADEVTKTWQGTWNNRKYNTSGPLKCVARKGENGEWKGVFTGKFQGDPFRYEAVFQSQGSRNRLQLSGKAKVRGHDYEWTGSLTGRQLMGKYRSSVGYYGEFKLQETQPRR